ncbi:MAG: hypothetical protein JXR96_30690 [Deltaproteobacteria bacterium]|nr:hypothetical protein [Deltaproteobacteria bacterium]
MPLRTAEQARASAMLVQRFARNRQCFPASERPLDRAAGIFRRAENRQVFEILTHTGLPALRAALDAEFKEWKNGKVTPDSRLDPRMPVRLADGILGSLEVLAVYGQADDLPRIVDAARARVLAGDDRWTAVLGGLGRHAETARVALDALAEPLPEGALGVAVLGLANRLCRENRVARHPFDSQAGRERLGAYLRAAEPTNSSVPIAAAAALPFISKRDALLKLADSHPAPRVQLEAAWARAFLGQADGFARLARQARDPLQAQVAISYLRELGREDLLPKSASDPSFAAQAELAAWLARPSEFGRAPDKLIEVEQRELAWPTGGWKQLRLYRYLYHPEGDNPLVDGFAVLGLNRIFSMKATRGVLDVQPSEIYASACCWDLQQSGDPRAEGCDVQRGLELLGLKAKPRATP